MTRDDLKTRLQVHFESSDNLNDQDYDDAIQDGYEEIIAGSGCLFKAATLSFTANLSYYDLRNLLPDFLGIVAIFNVVTKRWMCPISYRKLDDETYDWETKIGTPDFFCPLSHRFMAIYRKPGVADYGNMYIFYRATAPILTGSTDILIPDDHMKIFEDYSFTDLNDRMQEFSKASRTFKEYVMGMEKFRQSIKYDRVPDRMPNLKG